jgi:hypothetical protein
MRSNLFNFKEKLKSIPNAKGAKENKLKSNILLFFLKFYIK